MKVAITGATGHVGCNLVPEMLEKGYELRLLRHKTTFGLDGVGAEIVEGDVLDPPTLDALIRDVDAVIHLAAKISIDGDPSGEVTRVNRDGTINVLDACLRHGIERLVHFSTIHAYDPHPLDETLDETRPLIGDRGSKYDQSKVAGELAVLQAVRDKGFDAVVVTPTSVFGPYDHYPSLLGQAIMDMYSGKVPALVPGGYDFVPAIDIARGTIAALEGGQRGEKYLLSGQFLTVLELCRLVGEISQRRTTQRVMPVWALKMLIPVFRAQSRINGKPPLFTQESLKALIESNPNISSRKAEEQLGYKKTPVSDAMRETLLWFRNAGMIE